MDYSFIPENQTGSQHVLGVGPLGSAFSAENSGHGFPLFRALGTYTSGPLPVPSIRSEVIANDGGKACRSIGPNNLREASQDLFEDLTDELRAYLKEGSEQSGRCMRCGAFTEKVPPLNIDRAMALYDL